MPPQKRGRNSDKPRAAAVDHADAEMADGHSSASGGNAAPVDSDDDSDSDDDDDELTFHENANEDDDDDDEEDEDDEMDGSGDAGADGRNINVEFVFSDPREEHFHSVKQFLLSYLPSSQPFNVSGLANVVVNQVASGTMVCVEGESDVYGFITALSLPRYKDEGSIQQVLHYITKRCPPADAARLQEILQTKTVGLVINERMVNLPYQLVPPLHSALHEDIEWAIENEGTPELRASFKFDYFLILSSCTMDKASTGAAPSGKGKKAKTDYAQTAKFFANFEDEFLEPEAELVCLFETPRGERERAENYNKHSVVMLIERARHKAALANIAAMINM